MTPQSALDVAGRDAAQIAQLFSVMSIGAVIVWVTVVVIAVYTIRVRGSHSERAASLLIIGGGVVLPTLTLAALLAYGLPVLPAVLTPAPDGALRIRVTGKQWWWRVQYMTEQGVVETANELRLPVNQRVEEDNGNDGYRRADRCDSRAGCAHCRLDAQGTAPASPSGFLICWRGASTG